MIISFDGPAGSGKSTIAELVANELNFYHFNSGSVFRAITAHILNNNHDISTLKNANIQVEFINNVQHVSINEIDYTPILRDNNISVNVAKFSAFKEVQLLAQKIIKEFCLNNNVVIDGRGLGNEVLPNAEYKFYLDCSVEERARRRFLEEQNKGSNISLDEIKNQLIVRDKLDRERTIAPLIIPKDAIIIDSTHLTIDEVKQKILKIIKIWCNFASFFILF